MQNADYLESRSTDLFRAVLVTGQACYLYIPRWKESIRECEIEVDFIFWKIYNFYPDFTSNNDPLNQMDEI